MSDSFQILFPKIAISSLAAIVFGSGVIRLYLEVRPRFWPKTKGTVVSSTTQIQSYRTNYGGRATQVIPTIEIQYLWQGQTYSKNAGIYSSGYQAGAEAVVNRYPTGKTIDVMVNPKNPSGAEIEFKITPASWLIIFIGILLASVACYSWSW